MRSEVFGDLIFIDHVEFPMDDKYKMMFLTFFFMCNSTYGFISL